MALTKVPSNLDATIATTQSASDNSTNVATTAYVTTAISNLSDSAPAALNTLNEIAAALGDDANYASTTTAAIAAKLPLAGGTMTGHLRNNASFGVNLTTTVGVGGTPADANTVELGPGYLNLARDDTANAKQILFGKNGAVHSYLETTSGGLNIGGGNVAIGATSAFDNKLEVNGGDIRIRGTSTPSIKFNNADQEVVGMRLQSGATGNLSFHTNKMVITSDGHVGIGMTPAEVGSDTVLSIYDSDSPRIKLHNSTSGSASGDGAELNTYQSDFIIENREAGNVRFFNNGSERMRIGNTGKTSWSAGGVGAVATQARDFTFYTEGSTNGVAVHSNDQRLIFMGGAASSGSGVDTGYLQIEDAGTAKIVFNANNASYFNNGNLIVGGTSDSAAGGKFQIHATKSYTAGIPLGNLTIEDTASMAAGVGGAIVFTGAYLSNGTKTSLASIEASKADGTSGNYGGNLVFKTRTNGGNATERLRINDSGRQAYNGSASANGHGNFVGEVGTGYKALSFERTVGGGEVGSIVSNTSSTTYNTSSDYRLKENIDYTWDATTRLKQLKPARFNWIVDDTNTLLEGFLAHEVSGIVPEAIYGEKDAVDGDGNPEYQGIDHSKLVPLLVKTIQEQQTVIEDLKSRIETLEG